MGISRFNLFLAPSTPNQQYLVNIFLSFPRIPSTIQSVPPPRHSATPWITLQPTRIQAHHLLLRLRERRMPPWCLVDMHAHDRQVGD